MSWFEDAWQNTWGDLWDTISGNNQQQAARDAISTQAQAAQDALNTQIKALQLQQAQEQAFQQQMVDKQLAAAQQQGQIGTGMSLAQMLAGLQMAGAQQQMAMPQIQAQQALLSASLPNLMALSGVTPYSLPASVQTIDYSSLINQLPSMLSQGNQMAQNLYNQVYNGQQSGDWQTVASAQQRGIPLGTLMPTVVDNYVRNPNANGAGDLSSVPTSTPTSSSGLISPTRSNNVVMPAVYTNGQTSDPTLTVANLPVQGSEQFVPTSTVAGAGTQMPQVSSAIPLTTTQLTQAAPIDINKLVTGTPEYQLRNQTMNENLNRRLSGLGMQNSSDALYMQGRLSSDLMADAYNKAYEKQMNLYKLSQGMLPSETATNAATNTLNTIGSGLGNALSSAAQARSNIYANQAKQGSSLARLTSAVGNLNANNIAAQGNFASAWNQNNQPANWLDTGLKLYSEFSGLGNLGGGNSSDLDWWNALTKRS